MNPFDDPDGQFFVLTNEAGEFSLWPEFVAVPAGWSVVYGLESRAACLDYVDATWTEMRSPEALAQARPSSADSAANA